MPTMIVNAPIAATLPLLMRFFRRNSRPMQNSTNSTPMSPHAYTLAPFTKVSPNRFGPTKTPATMYPNTTGCFNNLNRILTTAAVIIRIYKSCTIFNYFFNENIYALNTSSPSTMVATMLACATFVGKGTLLIHRNDVAENNGLFHAILIIIVMTQGGQTPCDNAVHLSSSFCLQSYEENVIIPKLSGKKSQLPLTIACSHIHPFQVASPFVTYRR